MLLREIRELTDAEVLTGQDMIDTSTVKSVYASDLMSDVLAQVKGHPLLITGLCNPQVMRTAEMMDISCVLSSAGKILTNMCWSLPEGRSVRDENRPYHV